MSDFIAGKGTPRLIRVLSKPSGNIVSASAAAATIIICGGKHRLLPGMIVRIAGCDATPTDVHVPVNGDYTPKILDDSSFSIPVGVSVAGTTGSFEAVTVIYESSGATTYDATHAYETGAPDYTAIHTGHRLIASRVVNTVILSTYAKVLTRTVGVITIDAWSNGVPDAASQFKIDGFIVDLDRTQELTEKYTPDVLIHKIWRGDEGDKTETKHRGYKYEISLDYSHYTSADMLIALACILSCGPDDSIIIIPRKDCPAVQYNVYQSDPFELSKNRVEGHRKPVFTFTGKENVVAYGLTIGYGTNYANNYGVNL